MGDLLHFPAERVRQNTLGSLSEGGRQTISSLYPVRKNHQLSSAFDVVLSDLAKANRKLADVIAFGERLIAQRSHLSLLSNASKMACGERDDQQPDTAS